MSNFDLNYFLYNNTLLEDENKKSDKEIEDVFKDITQDFIDDLSDVKRDVKEGAPLVVAGISLALPEITKLVGRAAKKLSSVIGRTGNTGEKIIKVADKLHHAITGAIKKVLKGMGAKDGSTLDKFVNGLYHLLVASLMLASGAGSIKAFKAGKIVMSSLEAALTAVKSNEVGRFLQDLMGSGVMEEVSDKHNKKNIKEKVMKDFNYNEYLRNNPLTEQSDSEMYGSGDNEIMQLAADVVMGRISYKDAKRKAYGTKELQNAIEDIEAITGKSAPNYSIGDDYDADAEQDDENVGMGYDDEGRPLGEDKDPRQIEAEREMRDQAMVYYIGKLMDKEIDKLPDNPLKAYLDMLTQDQMDHDAETLRREIDENIMKEESYSLKQFQRDLVTYIRSLAKEMGLKPDTAVRMAVIALQNADDLKEIKLSERLNVSRDALTKVYKELGATTFSQMILNIRDENVLDELANEMGNQYRGVMEEGLTIGGKKVKAIHTHDSNNVEDHTIEYEDGTEEPYLKHIQMKEARDYRMTYPSYKVEEFNAIGDMAHNGILNLMSFAEQHKPEMVSKIKAVAEEVMNLIYDDMEEFDTQPRISVKEKKGKDHDGDGDIDSDDYKMAKDKAIKKAMKSETKSAPKGHYFTKSGNLVKGRLTKDARERGATQSDPLDKRRSKVPPVTQVREEDEPTAGQIKSSGGSLASIAGKLAKVAKDMKGLAKEYKVAKEAGDDKKVKDLLATLKVLTAHKKQLEKDLDNA